MDASGSFRFLIVTSALLLWVGAVATAGETTEAEEGQTPVEASSPAAPADDAPGEGGEAPTEESEEASES
jgi:hypothetical protein